MAQKLKAAVTLGPGKIEVQDFDMPKLGKGAAICKVLMAGVCGTDKHTYSGEVVQYKGTKDEFTIPFPIIQGHELCMEIAEIDEEGARNLSFDGDYLKVGDRVTICPDVVCGECWYCKNIPNYPWCEKAKFHYGHNKSCNTENQLYGGFSQYMYIEPGARLYKIPDTLPNDIACFTEVMCVTYALEKAREFSGFSKEGLNFGDTLVLQGVGPLGIAYVIMARMMGVGKIICTDISDYKLDIAKAFGADIVMNVEKTTPEERIARIKAETCGRGADVVVECVGRPEVFPEGLKYLRKAGMYIEPGNFVDCGSAKVNVHEICANNLRIIGMNNHTHNCYKTVMEMMDRTQHDFPWERLFSHRYTLAETEQAIKTSMTKESMKVLIDPWAE